ncbi:MAG: hypothetical protein K8S54_02500 [Spirochaetia bacterium]|nr:hypothetical protein [Spirochaetia bacterium]
MAVIKLVGMPIGNPEDVTLRALRAIREADLVCVEDTGTASRLFKQWGIPFPREKIRIVNEHTRTEELGALIPEIKGVSSTVLLSDAGMPVFCDPGLDVMRLCETAGVTIEVLPGASALMTAVVRAGINGPFYFAGFPPRKTEDRGPFFKRMDKISGPVIFYETPYRLTKLLGDIHSNFQPAKKVFVCVNLTDPGEVFISSDVQNVQKLQIPQGPPVVIVGN